MGAEAGWRTSADGSTVLLFPAALFIVLGLGLATVDAAVAFLAQRHLGGVAEAVATEVVAGLDVAAFHHDGALALDVDRAAGRIGDVLEAADADPLTVGLGCEDPVVSGTRVTVRCTAEPSTRLLPTTGRRQLTASRTVAGVVG